ncbi:hypothetical protein ENSA5_15220 [Enhygromyxa salina]|uniref:Uncharacterized protein n=1 Tax=Enhygromyxa salina TaxID=215803 RepID=A0A2S9YEN9_9BACT|nr:hypothetical protein [Enhygromyxa salina]PRQ03492.1 hypothetical protein ENSA5_15220 [Enhygromyxa salina]
MFRALEQRLAELRAINDVMAGIEVDRAEILLHADLERHELVDRWLEWADAYVQHRLSRKNPKDEGNPLLTYLRIYDELLPWFDELAYGKPEDRRIDTVHRHILGSVVEYIPWRLYPGATCGAIRPLPRHRTPHRTKQRNDHCRHTDEACSWARYPAEYTLRQIGARAIFAAP